MCDLILQTQHKQCSAFIWYSPNKQVFLSRIAHMHHPKYTTHFYTLEPKHWTEVLPELKGL